MDSLHLSQSKKNAQAEGAAIVYVDEASFRQCPTLHQTWAPLNCRPEIPTRGERNTQKILGALSLREAKFAYRHPTEYFNHVTYQAFVQEIILPTYDRRGHRIYLIQDNASYHTPPEVWAWFKEPRHRLEVFPRPKYSPEFNVQERLWHCTRREATPNRFFEKPADLCARLFQTFEDVRQHPEKIRGWRLPLF
ncbi:MAG TPA: IS630 family transposase [Candidatus Saccharimonadales bacterium]|nr:IS630 family transposase [Candidatus Saccharimonadales bacterium]